MKRKFLLLPVVIGAFFLMTACADSEKNNSTTPPAQSYNITGKIDYAGKTISYAKVCLDVNNNGLADDTSCIDTADNNYNFTSVDNPASYSLVAFIKEANTAVNAKIIVDNIEYDSILYAPKGKTDIISIATTFAKSLMDKDSSLTLADAENTADTIIQKADNPAVVLTVYNNALNTASNSIDISTSIRGLIYVITNKLSSETNITNNTIISVTQEEVNTANEAIKAEDDKLPQNPDKTPFDRISTILDNAQEMPVIDLTQEKMAYYPNGEFYDGHFSNGRPVFIIQNLDASVFLNTPINVDIVFWYIGYSDKKYRGSYDNSERLFYLESDDYFNYSSIEPCSGIIEDTYITFNDENILQTMMNNADCMVAFKNPNPAVPNYLNYMANCLETVKKEGFTPVKAKYRVDTNNLTNYSCGNNK